MSWKYCSIDNIVAHQPADLDSWHSHYRLSNESNKRDPADKCPQGHGNVEAVGRLSGHQSSSTAIMKFIHALTINAYKLLDFWMRVNAQGLCAGHTHRPNECLDCFRGVLSSHTCLNAPPVFFESRGVSPLAQPIPAQAARFRHEFRLQPWQSQPNVGLLVIWDHPIHRRYTWHGCH